MFETDKRYYKINIGGNDHIFTNIMKDGDHYIADNVDGNGKPTYTSRLSQAEIDSAVISDSMIFVEKPADFVFRLRLVNASEYDNGNKETSDIHLEFPQQANDIENALEEIGLPPDAEPGQYFIDGCECILKSLNSLVDMYSDIYELADISKRLDTLDGFTMLKLNSIMESNAAFENLAQVKEFTYNRDYYGLEFEIEGYTQLGLLSIYKSGVCDNMPDYYKDAINPADFGRYIAEAERGFFSSNGYLYQTGDKWNAVDLPDFKPKPLIAGAADRSEHPIDTIESFAADLDSFYRGISNEYTNLYDDEIRVRYRITELVQTGRTDELKMQMRNMQREYYIDNADMQVFIQRLENFERCKGIYIENAEEREEKNMSDKMKVLVVEPMQEPYTKEIDAGLKSLQNEVGGIIQAVYPFEEEAAIICNDEGKLNGLKLNRALYDEDGKIYDIVAGTFLICGLTEDNFGSLSDELINKFSEQFKQPEIFFRHDGEIKALPVEIQKPSIKEQLQQTKKEQGEQSEQKQSRQKPPEL